MARAPNMFRRATDARVGASVLVALAAWIVILAAFGETVASMVRVWSSSGTFGHCFVVLPIAFWMAWTRRAEIPWGSARPWLLPVAGIVVAGLAWTLGALAAAASVQQFAIVVMLQLSLLAVVGPRVGAALAYPIGFLLFAVPTGEFLTPTMIDHTADFTVAALQLTGVPIYREGNDFLIPTGRWSVVEACSGVRYLFASMMAGTAYAYVQFGSHRKRWIFIAISAVVPVVANWLRAYLIVMTGHLSKNEYATGADHLIYGAVFFGVIIFVLFGIGNRFRDAAPACAAVTDPIASSEALRRARGGAPTAVRAACLAVAAAVFWIPVALVLQGRLSAEGLRLANVSAPAGWVEASGATLPWRPVLVGPRAEVARTFTRDGAVVGLAVGYFARQGAGAELATQSHAFTLGSDGWRAAHRRVSEVPGAAGPIPVRSAVLQGDVGRVAIRTWIWLDGRYPRSDYMLKALTVGNVLLHGRDDAAIVVAWSSVPDGETESAALDAFVRDMAGPVERVLAAARPR